MKHVDSRTLFSIASAALLSALCSCGADVPPQAVTPKPSPSERTITLGVSLLDFSNPYYSRLYEGIKNAAAKENIMLIPNDPRSDLQAQLRALEYFISVPVDGIIIAALDQDLVEPYLLQARKRGIKIVAQSTKVENCDIFVSFEEWDIGHALGVEAGAWAERHGIKRPKVALLNYPSIARIKIREKGILDGIGEFVPDFEVAARFSASTPSQGAEAAGRLFADHPDLDIVVGINDGGALGVLNFLRTRNIATKEDFFLGGIDATPEALAAIESGSVYRCTVDIKPYFSGELDVEFARRLILGKRVPSKYSNAPRAILQGSN